MAPVVNDRLYPLSCLNKTFSSNHAEVSSSVKGDRRRQVPHHYVKELIENKEVAEAWKVLLLHEAEDVNKKESFSEL